MNEIKHTGGVWILDHCDSGRLYVAQQYGDTPGGRICEVFENCLVRGREREANARLIAAAPGMAEILEIIAADADAGEILLTSGIRMALDAALIKAGRKAAPTPVRHVTIAGVDR
ncbi:hypothetical protein KDW55_02290 [Burkholderia sp. AU19243]|uniref:hypothetical protein n=1 Tax=Burkholderia sp. AU19243 TaxID=2824810 RepID=UPI001B934E73|nr:hypothetical protein [Burkholderia sp. AU19243]MBR8362147.1 hypothetical protein [Burkholderia sp. AU19243]